MTYEQPLSALGSESFYINLFNALPGNSILLRADAPQFTIIAAAPEYSKLTGIKREALIGKGLFEVFPSNPNDPNDTGAEKIRASLAYVLTHKVAHELPVQRYDSVTEEGHFIERYWRTTNSPVLSNEGEVQFIVHITFEITDLVMAERKAQATADIEKAYQFFMNAPVIIGFLKGDDYRIELANEPLLEVWGRKADIIGKPLLVAIPELEEQGFIPLLDQVRNTGNPFFAYEYPITLNRHGKEEELYFDFVYKPYYENDTTGRATGIISVGHDVTAQVLARQKVVDAQKTVERQERLFEAINGSIPDLIYVFDLDYRFTYANTALLTMWGKTYEESIGRSLLENGYEPWHAEMHEREIDQVVATKASIRGEVSFPHATLGKRVYDYIFVPVINEQGEVEAVAGTTRDITELKLAELSMRESEERFRSLADQSPIIIYIVEPNPEATMSYFNKAWLDYTGQTFDQALGRAWDGIVHPDDVQVILDIYTPAFISRQSYTLPAIRLKRYDGKYRWHHFKGTPRFLPSGEFIGYIGVGFDIHEQKLAEEVLKQNEIQLQQKVAERTIELEKTVKELKRSNRNLEEFAYAASHDLKEPVRKIQFFSDRIKDTMRNRMAPDELRYFERMESASKRMGSLIDDLLTYSQISIQPQSFEEVHLNQLLDQVLEDLDLEIEDKEAVVVVDVPFTIKAHQRQLQQAFQNLISNALKYNKPGIAPEIKVQSNALLGKDTSLNLSPEDQQKRFYHISITDNGIGFEQADADRIFNVFTRLHGNAEYRGTGIGLSIVRKVIENHNGRIWAESQLGQGSTFHVLLPEDL